MSVMLITKAVAMLGYNFLTLRIHYILEKDLLCLIFSLAHKQK